MLDPCKRGLGPHDVLIAVVPPGVSPEIATNESPWDHFYPGFWTYTPYEGGSSALVDTGMTLLGRKFRLPPPTGVGIGTNNHPQYTHSVCRYSLVYHVRRHYVST